MIGYGSPLACQVKTAISAQEVWTRSAGDDLVLKVPRHAGEVRWVFVPGVLGWTNHWDNGVRVDTTVGESDNRKLAKHWTIAEQSMRMLVGQIEGGLDPQNSGVSTLRSSTGIKLIQCKPKKHTSTAYCNSW